LAQSGRMEGQVGAGLGAAMRATAAGWATLWRGGQKVTQYSTSVPFSTILRVAGKSLSVRGGMHPRATNI